MPPPTIRGEGIAFSGGPSCHLSVHCLSVRQCPLRVTRYFLTYSMDLTVTNIHNVSGNCWKDVQSQCSRPTFRYANVSSIREASSRTSHYELLDPAGGRGRGFRPQTPTPDRRLTSLFRISDVPLRFQTRKTRRRLQSKIEAKLLDSDIGLLTTKGRSWEISHLVK